MLSGAKLLRGRVTATQLILCIEAIDSERPFALDRVVAHVTSAHLLRVSLELGSVSVDTPWSRVSYKDEWMISREKRKRNQPLRPPDGQQPASVTSAGLFKPEPTAGRSYGYEGG